jgi:hypothetical protein
MSLHNACKSMKKKIIETIICTHKVNTDNIFYIHGNIDDEKVILGHREDNPFKSYYAIDEGSYLHWVDFLLHL